MNNIAISYARFSSAEQSAGDSLRRQIDAAEKYAEEHGLLIDRSLSFRDLGVSAYDQSNIRKGALGLFLKAVEKDQIPRGSTLIIESFDRLSRAQPLDAMGVFTDILNAGLNIVTLIDKQKFSRESVHSNPAQLLMSLVTMYRAHEESATKSSRLKAAWSNKKSLLRMEGKVLTAKTPHWIRVLHDRSGFQEIPERVDLIKRIVEMSTSGIGNHTIIKTLHKEEIPAWSSSNRWQPSYIQKMMTNPALYGGILIDGEIIENYYPAVISREEYDYLQANRSARATTKNTNRKGQSVTNLFSGILRCGYCGSSMNIAGYKSIKSGYERKYLACQGARTGATQCKMWVWFLDELEPTLLFFLTHLDYSKLMGLKNHDKLQEARQSLASLEAKIKKLNTAIDNGNDAIEQGSSSMIPRVRQHEIELHNTTKLLADQHRKVNALMLTENTGSSRMNAILLLFKSLKETTDEIQLRTLREQISAAINQVVETITLYPIGHTRKDPARDERFIDILFKNGAEQRIEPGEC